MAVINSEATLPRALRRAQEKYQAFRSATTHDQAHDAWEDFLVYWHRAVNKIELKGEGYNGKNWLRTQVLNDPVLKYLRVARNAGDHGLAPVMQTVGGGTAVPGFMIDIGSGLGISPRGRVGMMLAGGLGMEFLPETLELAEVHTERGDSCSPPTKNGKRLRAMELADIGLAFLTSSALAVS